MENGVTTDAADVSTLVNMFEEAEQSTRPAREKAERDRDYYDGKQWTDAQISKLEKRNQPVVTFNRIQRKIDFLSGLEKQQRKDPKAFPRTPKDEDAADAATDAIRYACDDENWDDKRSAAWDNLLIEGSCAVLVGVKPVKGGYDPQITHIPWDRFFYDPASSKYDFADARYMGIVTWYDYDAALRKWPNAKDVLEATLNHSRDTDTYDDKPKDKLWADPKRKRVRVIELYHMEGEWTRCVFTFGGYLEPKAASPYLNEEGKPENPIKARSLYIDRDNNRYGSVRVMISAQDEVNKRRSKALWRSSMRQIRVSPGAAIDGEEARREAARPDGVLTAEKDELEILSNGDLLAAELNMLQEAKNEIDLLGANAALAGKNENDMSGRAILAQQQGGMVEVARMFDRLRSLSIEVYRALWNRIRQVWTNEKWVRVTDDEQNMRFVGLNQQVTVAMIAQEVAKGDPQGIQAAMKLVGPQLMQAYLQGDQQAQMMLGLFVQQNGQQVVETRNAVNELDVDIVLDESMDTPTVQAEQFETLAKIIPGIVNLPPVYAKMLIRASQFRDKDQILEDLESSQQVDPMAQQMQALQFEGAKAEVEKTQSETVKNYAQAEAADPNAQLAIEERKAEHQMGMAEQKQAHGMQMAQERHEQGMVQAERGQSFKEQMAQRQQREPA